MAGVDWSIIQAFLGLIMDSLPPLTVPQAIRLTMRPHLLALQRPSGLPPSRSLVKAKVLRIDPSRGLLLKVGDPSYDWAHPFDDAVTGVAQDEAL